MRNTLRVSLAAACLALALAGCAGPAGPAGESCTVTDNGDGTSSITCSGTTVVVKNGTSGASCSVTANPDAGTKTITCTDGTTTTISDGKPGVDANATINFATLTAAELAAADFSLTVQSVSADAKPVVKFTVRDAKGAGVRGIAPANFSGIGLLQLVPGNTADGGNGLNIDTWVSHMANCATCSATRGTETADAKTLVDNGDGSYTYTFKKDVINDGGTAIAGVTFDANAPHRFGIRLGANGNPYRPVDAVFDYTPATGANITGQNDKVLTVNCLECHVLWRANALNAGGAVPFHGGMRYEAQYCVLCHNDQAKYSSANPPSSVSPEPTINGNVLTSTLPDGGLGTVSVFRGEAIFNLPVWIHKIHRGKDLYYQSAKTSADAGTYPAEGPNFKIGEATFPQDLRNCDKCHKGAAKGANWKNKPSRRACGACHDNVDFSSHPPPPAMPQNLTDDRQCGTCHAPGGPYDHVVRHTPVAPPAPNNIFSMPDGGSSSTNASYLGSALNPPAGARVLSYVLVPDGGAVTAVKLDDGGINPKVTFKLVDADGGNVVFNAAESSPEMLDNFVGSPSVYCVFAMPQDSIQPGDFNTSVYGYLKDIWKGTATGAFTGTLSAPDTNGYYSVQLTGVTIPPTATMLTCGVGYTYNLTASSRGPATPPLVQTNLPGYAYDAGVGGLSIPAQDVWAVAAGYAGRRGATNSKSTTGQIANTAKCNTCHQALGVTPSYHAGQRNDAATCAFCHTPNRTSSGWSAGSESFIHGIHSASFRNTKFNWHATSATEGFYDTTYPGRLQFCESCHNAGYFDFSDKWYNDNNLATRQLQTVATGTPKSSDIALSPYVTVGTPYGLGWSYDATTQVVTEAAPTTLVNSPITNVCFSCHDGKDSQEHMKMFGGSIYLERDTAKTKVEQCLICHGPGKVAAIKDVHYK